MASSTGDAPPILPNAPAVGRGDVLHLQLQQEPTGSSDAHGNATPMNPLLLASVCVGSSAALNFLFGREDSQEPPMMMPTQAFLDRLAGSSTGGTVMVPQACGDVENGVCLPAVPGSARLLEGVTAEGDTALHAVATYGDGAEFLECASIINTRDTCLLLVVNNNGDTPMHCAARAGNSQMLACLIQLAGTGDRMHGFLRKQNVLKETTLHEAIRVGNKHIVERLLKADPLLANFPDQGTSPLYLAILQGKNTIAEVLHDMSGGNVSYDGPHGRNALHAATFQGQGITKDVLNWKISLTAHGDSDGSTPLHLASSFKHSVVFMLLLEANPAVVFQADNKGLFPIHVAASVGVQDNVQIILDKYPSCAGLRTAQGRTFLHVAVEKRRLNIVSFVSHTASLAWILNMRDNDGNTAMHLAAKSGRLRIFCSLYGNKKVLLSSPNNSEETPVSLSNDLIPRGLYHGLSNEKGIYRALAYFGNNPTGLRLDLYEEKYSHKLEPDDMDKEEEKVKDSSQILGISSVLIHYRNASLCRRPLAMPTAFCRGRRHSPLTGYGKIKKKIGYADGNAVGTTKAVGIGSEVPTATVGTGKAVGIASSKKNVRLKTLITFIL